ncbi:2'-aminobiphenyl-2,3-diol 1,2-dioxygenase, large subunit [Thermomonospora echinospora]|uniref:2'-aminobiphenyl-2,3-diol 1,2-dioxygenase, large subunit n=1 Tax=Thermomonospora echinospora TaxID=1992 RepID=A0A1H6DSV9_9ACTN|nr:2,3-dihydroxyphenylpropionate 1,2-dioxygenase [Thermomonospora echinospora]SEG87806.1 2'-aminobiphenyl-2,3-diol 1,2-dioxygenase, large subunit [Thermomonospora echinospora]
MGHLALAAATSHVGAIVKHAQADPEVSGVLHDAWRRLDAEIAAARLDAVVVAATDHYETFGLENYPAFCLGLAEEHHGWAEFGNPGGTVPGRPEVAEALLEGLTARGFDLARSHTMALDHSFMVPLTKLPSAAAAGIVPLFVNCNTPPLPTLGRCLALGAALRDTVRALPGDARIGVIGTGGLSHWVGLPRFGEINEEFDTRFLALLREGRAEEVLTWDDAHILNEAGNGALEIRTWLIAAGAAGGPARVHAYRPMPAWTVGIGVSGFEVTP